MLPSLRQELSLHTGPQADDGSPSWTLHDPASNRFYALSWPAFELLSRWQLGSEQAVLEAVNTQTTLRLSSTQLQGLIHMLASNHLLVAATPQASQGLAQAAQAQRPTAAQWLLKNYLYIKVPLLRPTPWLQRLTPKLGFFYHRGFWLGVLAMALLGLVLTAQRFEAFSHTFMAYGNWQGLLAMGLALSLAKVVHELGHAITATRHGCRVPTMGVALMVMWPVLYTDTTEAWKLHSRRHRLQIAAAGMLSELALASAALLLWHLLPESPQFGPLRSGLFLLATATWVLTLAINASPFMRFDGYFLLADALNMPNLHERSFALARWWLRERLFGFGAAPPEAINPGRRAGLVAFAWATWVYRAVLFLGIALLVYHLFFKALGLVLMAVELWWFLARPVWRELKAWHGLRQHMRWNQAALRSLVLAGSSCLALLWPWQTQLRAPAVLGAQQAQAVYAPHAGQLAQALPTAGQALAAGQPMLQMRSPELELRLRQAQTQEQQWLWRLNQQAFDAQLLEAGASLRTRWQAAVAEVAGVQQELARLGPAAPFAAGVAEPNEELQAGGWVRAGERLFMLLGPQGAKVDVFVGEAALAAVAVGQRARFVPQQLDQTAVDCQVARVDPIALYQLDAPLVASTHGGDVPVHTAADGRLLPLQPTFRLRLEGCNRGLPPAQELAGTALLQGERRTMLGRGWRLAWGVWQREAVL